MYHYSKLINNDFAARYYKVPYREFDHIKSKKEKEYFKFNTHQKKRPKGKYDRLGKESRERDFEMITKHSRGVPAPWNYELGLKWMKGPNAREIRKKMTRDRKKLLKKWKGKNAGLVDEVDRFARDEKKSMKLDMNVKAFLTGFFFIGIFRLKRTRTLNNLLGITRGRSTRDRALETTSCRLRRLRRWSRLTRGTCSHPGRRRSC